MKIVCLECHCEIGEKSPFEDLRETHTICHECIELKWSKPGKEGLRRKFVQIHEREG